METNKERFYNEVVSKIVQNVLVEYERNGRIVINNFYPNIPAHRLYFEASLVANAVSNEPIYIHCSIWRYWKFKLTHWKFHKILRYARENAEVTSVSVIMNFIRQYYGLDWSDFDNIVKEFYENNGSQDNNN